jgi:hypothetical protein
VAGVSSEIFLMDGWVGGKEAGIRKNRFLGMADRELIRFLSCRTWERFFYFFRKFLWIFGGSFIIFCCFCAQ